MVSKMFSPLLKNHFSVTTAMAQMQMAAIQGVKGILDNPQAQYLQARQAHQARMSMASAPDIAYERPEPKPRKGHGII